MLGIRLTAFVGFIGFVGFIEFIVLLGFIGFVAPMKLAAPLHGVKVYLLPLLITQRCELIAYGS